MVVIDYAEFHFVSNKIMLDASEKQMDAQEIRKQYRG